MEPTEVERWILANQYSILEKVDPKRAEDHAHAREAVENGYELEYAKYHGVVADTEVISRVDAKEVYTILSMFATLDTCYRGMEDKSGIDPSKLKFQGFDSEVEGGQWLYTQFLQNERRQYSGVSLSLDSYTTAAMLPIYRAMAKAWIVSADMNNLSKEDLIRISNAGWAEV